MKTKLLLSLALLGITTTFKAISQPTNANNGLNKGGKNSTYFTLNAKAGNKLGTVFMRTISFQSNDFPEIVNRVSGTGNYTVKSAGADSSSFIATFRIDGFPAGAPMNITISDAGRLIAFNGKKANPNREGSGVAFNAFLWGTPPANLKKGDKWKVHIDHDWESGSEGDQDVTVLWADPANHSICLRREGNSEGFFDGENKNMTIKKDGADVKVLKSPGTTHWTGYTIFKDGLVVSDELMAYRPIKLTADGKSFDTIEREYMMLNAMPVE